MDDQTAEQELVQRAKNGDVNAFNALVKKYWNELKRFTMDYGVDESVVGNIFVTAYRGMHSLRNNASFSTWLRTITVHQCLNEKRTGASREVVGVPVEKVERLGEEASAQEAFFREESIAAMRGCIEELPNDLKLVIRLMHLEDNSAEAVSRVLGVPATTVRSRQRTAFNALKKCLEGKGESLGS
jgi:RNA polymerase sigma-70 factor (ECF subfamily)